MMDSLLGYLDPGSGSLLVQVLLGGSAALMVGLRLGWGYVCSWFGKRPADLPPETQA